MTFRGRLIEGRFVLDDRDSFAKLKAQLEGQEIELRLQKKAPIQDITALRGYFHGAVLPAIAKSAGYLPTEKELAMVKQGLKEKFLTIFGSDPPEVRSTESLSASEYFEFVEHCRIDAAETFGLYIDDPH